MKRFSAVILISLLLTALLCAALSGFAADEGEPKEESAVYKGIVAFATDMDSDGFLDNGGKIEINLVLPGGKGLCNLTFSKSDFAEIAVSSGAKKNVSLAAGTAEGYAVNTVVDMHFYGFTSVFDGEITESKKEEIKKGFAFAAKNGEASVLPTGNELYSTYLLTDSGKKAALPKEAASAAFSFRYNEGKGSAELSYRGVTYTVVKKLINNDVENPIVITVNGKAASPAETEDFLLNFAEGEIEVLFGDLENEADGQIFELADIRSARAFAPVSAELNALSGKRDEAFSYVLFDREVRFGLPCGYAFSAREAEGAGLNIVLCTLEAGAGYYESARLFCRSPKSGECEEIEYARGEKITDAKREGEFVRVALESGKSLLLPSKSALENREMSAELFYNLNGAEGSVSVIINSPESSWFSSLAIFYSENGAGAEKLAGKRLTAAFDAEGHAIFAEIE
jgi:hypothetical protein